jgi:hypothetical protein
MTEIQELLNQIDVDQVASVLGTDPASAQTAVEAALPTLLAGMHHNAQAPDGAASLQSALGQHQDGLLDGSVDVSQVDAADGEKIVGHVFGGQQDQVAAQLAGTAGLGGVGGVGGDLIRKALPILAPIVMSYLAKKIFGQGGSGQAAQPGGTGAGGGQAGGIDLGGILGGILGAGAGASGPGAGAGGSAGAGQGSVLDSVLGGLGGLFGKK